MDAKLSDLVSGQFGAMLSFIAGATSHLVGGGYALFNVLSLVVVTPVVGFYLLRDWPRVVAMVDSWLPRRYQGVVRAQAREVDRILSAWVRGQAMCCMILAIFYALGLSIVGLELGLVVGLAAGFLSFIPYVGTITGAVVSIGLAFAQFPTWEGVVRVALVFGVGQILEGYVIYPRFSRRPGRVAGGVGDFCVVRRWGGVRFSGRDARGAGGRHRGCAGAVLAAALPEKPALSGAAELKDMKRVLG